MLAKVTKPASETDMREVSGMAKIRMMMMTANAVVAVTATSVLLYQITE
ncbi:MAG: hypothetical protein ACRDBO_06065 [Lachnospiraceae bacterium]